MKPRLRSGVYPVIGRDHFPGSLRGEGFSLLELLVGMAILCALVVMLGQMLSFTSSAWIQNRAGIERLQNVRISTDFIGKELNAALLPVDRTSTNSLQFVINPPGLDASTYGNRDTVFWQTPSSVNDSLGNVAEIGYFVKWDTTTKPANPRPNLCRFFLPASDPNRGLAAAASSVFVYTKSDAWITDSIVSDLVPADKASGYQGLFAENVVGLWVRPFDTHGAPLEKDFSGGSMAAGQTFRYDSRAGYTDSANKTSPGYQPPGGGAVRPLAALPPAVDLGFVIIDSASASRITPAIQTELVSLVRSSPDAKAFVNAALAASALEPVKRGLRYYQTRIFLENSQ